ncbi:hypothetical protein AB4Y38_41390 [Paraburkholderia sp. EG285A]|uniref:hypothetical protein n=1 Tax=Paraburkholderia sp. EG285A TaxID=3237009 RepID=UPI0034D2BCD1
MQDRKAKIELQLLRDKRRDDLGDQHVLVTLAHGEIHATSLLAAQRAQLSLQLFLPGTVAAPELRHSTQLALAQMRVQFAFIPAD